MKFFRKKMLDWFKESGRDFPWRKAQASEFEKIITEILLQRTQAGTVANIYSDFFANFRSWEDLASAPIEDIGQQLKPIGLWRQRAPKLKRLAQVMVSRKNVMPQNRVEIDALPGVGQYIANSIELLLQKKRKPLLDVNMARVLERYFGPRKLADIRYDPYLQKLSHQVVRCKDPISINFAILDFAALVCKARNPLCESCPLNKKCLFYKKLSKRK